jgi:hypothetical protein
MSFENTFQPIQIRTECTIFEINNGIKSPLSNDITYSIADPFFPNLSSIKSHIRQTITQHSNYNGFREFIRKYKEANVYVNFFCYLNATPENNEHYIFFDDNNFNFPPATIHPLYQTYDIKMECRFIPMAQPG